MPYDDSEDDSGDQTPQYPDFGNAQVVPFPIQKGAAMLWDNQGGKPFLSSQVPIPIPRGTAILWDNQGGRPFISSEAPQYPTDGKMATASGDEELPPLPANIQPHEWKYIQQALQLRNQMKFRAEQAAAAKYKSEEDAIRFQGQQEYNDLLNQGASVQEAFRRAAPKLYYHNPLKQAESVLRFQKSSAEMPLVTEERNGQTFYKRGMNQWSHVPKEKENANLPPDVKEEVRQSRVEEGSLRKDLQKAVEADQARSTPAKKAEVARAKAALNDALLHSKYVAAQGKMQPVGLNPVMGESLAARSELPATAPVLPGPTEGTGLAPQYQAPPSAPPTNVSTQPLPDGTRVTYKGRTGVIRNGKFYPDAGNR